MTTLAIDYTDMVDDARALTVEGIYRKYGTFGGVLSYQFDDDVTGWNATHWDTATNIAYGSTLSRTGTTGAETLVWCSSTFPHSYTCEFTAHTGKWSVLLRGNKTDNYYRLDYDISTGVQASRFAPGELEVVFFERALSGQELTSLGRVQISVRDGQLSSDSGQRVVYIGCWVNGINICSISDVRNGNAPLYAGFVVPAGAAGTVYSGFRVPNLGEIVLISSLDPGEFPLDAISRAIEDRYIRMWSRQNGTLRAWSPKARTVSQSIGRDREIHLQLITDLRQLFSHVRVLGAFQWVQVKDDVLIALIGHRFRELNNTALWNTDDCIRIGYQMLMRAHEQAFQAQIDTFGYPFLEPEDRISVPDDTSASGSIDYIVDAMSFSYTQSDALGTQLTLRKYLYGEA